MSDDNIIFEPSIVPPSQSGFTCWDRATGRIVSYGMCPPEMIAIQAGEGQDYTDEMHNDALFYMLGGVLTPRPVVPSINPSQIVGVGVEMPGVLPGSAMALTDSFNVTHHWSHDPTDPLILTDAGHYKIQIVQNFPAHSATWEIDVLDA